MRTWRLVIFGREIVRTEVIEDPDKTLIEAIEEMIDDEDFDEDLDEEIEELEAADENDHSFANFGRTAGEEEHLVFPPEEEDAD